MLNNTSCAIEISSRSHKENDIALYVGKGCSSCQTVTSDPARCAAEAVKRFLHETCRSSMTVRLSSDCVKLFHVHPRYSPCNALFSHYQMIIFVFCQFNSLTLSFSFRGQRNLNNVSVNLPLPPGFI